MDQVRLAPRRRLFSNRYEGKMCTTCVASEGRGPFRNCPAISGELGKSYSEVMFGSLWRLDSREQGRRERLLRLASAGRTFACWPPYGP